MNERIGNNKIYLLAKEAGLIEFEQLDWNSDLGSPTYESVAKARKFAELIVRECMDQCEEIAVSADKIANGQFVTDAGRMLHQGMWGGAKNCIVQIKEHFGVE